MTTKEVIAQGGIEKIGLKGSFLKLTLPNGESLVVMSNNLYLIDELPQFNTKIFISFYYLISVILKGSFLKLTLPNGEKKILEKDIPEHTVGVEFILNTLIPLNMELSSHWMKSMP